MKRITIIAFLLSICSVGIAKNKQNQPASAYCDGYYIDKSTKDTVRGQVNLTKTDVSALYFKDLSGVEKKYAPRKVRGFYRSDVDKYYLGYKKGDIQYFYPRILTGYYDLYVIGFVKVVTEGGVRLSSTENVWYVIQHGNEEIIDIFGFPWKKRLLEAVADNEKLHTEISSVETVQVKVNLPTDELKHHRGHPMHNTPEWIETYNKWKSELK